MYGAVDKVSKTGDTMTGPLDGTSILTAVVVLAYASTITPNAQAGGHFRLTLTGNPTINPLANPGDGQKVTFELIQDSAGSRTVTWAAGYVFGASGAPTLTATALKRDLPGFIYSADLGAWMFAGIQKGF
jgi:hypothetical protein